MQPLLKAKLIVGAVLFILASACVSLGSDGQSSQTWQGWYSYADRQIPLATDGNQVFAVSKDHRTILTRFLAEHSGWHVFEVYLPLKRIGGIACWRNYLYVTDLLSGSIVRLDLETHRHEIVYENDGILKSPTAIASVGDVLYVVDPSIPALFRIPVIGGKPEIVTLPSPWVFDPSSPIVLAADQQDLAIANGQRVLKVIHAATPARSLYIQIYPVIRSVAPVSRKTPKKVSQDSVVRNEIILRKPTALSIFRGVIYAWDESAATLVALPSSVSSPVRITYDSPPVTSCGGIMVLDDRILLAQAKDAELVEWPLLTPVEVRLTNGPVDGDILFSLLKYLDSHGLLPQETRPGAASVKWLLEQVGIPSSPKVSNFVCSLNRLGCSSAGTVENSRIPILYVEDYIDAQRVHLDNQRTLGHLVDVSIRSPEFQEWKSEPALASLNMGNNKDPFQRPSQLSYRTMKEGTFTVPKENYRLVFAVLDKDLIDPHSELRRIESYGVAAVSLNEIPSSAYHAASPYYQQPQDWSSEKAAYFALLKSIHYIYPAGPSLLSTPYIGVSEAEFDCDNPDFGGDACESLADEVAPVPATATVPSSVYKLRDFSDGDHGTSVAYLIAARRSEYGGKGLAPQAVLISVANREPIIGDSIRHAYLDSGVRIYNISSAFPPGIVPMRLQAAITVNYKDALFVVAAGNGSEEVCTSAVIFPACWGDLNNVLVVGATTLDGGALLPTVTSGGVKRLGSNWNNSKVHVLAPGEGYYAGGRDRSYVPVRGTSFATPLVTATAALLYAEGIHEPWLIKQRIIATSDQGSSIQGKSVGGLINVERAVSFPSKAVLLSSRTNPADLVEVIPTSQLVFQWPQGTDTVPIRNVRRMVREDNGSYRVFFLDAGGMLRQVSGINPPASGWKIKGYRIDETTMTHKSGKIEIDLAGVLDYTGPIE